MQETTTRHLNHAYSHPILNQGKLCDVSQPPFNAKNSSNATEALTLAINECGDLPEGGMAM